MQESDRMSHQADFDQRFDSTLFRFYVCLLSFALRLSSSAARSDFRWLNPRNVSLFGAEECRSFACRARNGEIPRLSRATSLYAILVRLISSIRQSQDSREFA